MQSVLKVVDLNTGYGKKQVLFDVSLNVGDGELVSIIGPNGSGKSTILKAVSGVLPVWKGDVFFDGISVKANSTAKNIALGLTFSPQGNRVFDELTVLENLEIGGFNLRRDRLKERIEEVYKFFPLLARRSKQSAGTLSGGEQQMLALARALMPSPKLLLLDEPSLGLAPNLVRSVFDKLVQINQDFGAAILVVEQKVTEVLSICNRVYSIKLGRVAFGGAPEELREDKRKVRDLFL